MRSLAALAVQRDQGTPKKLGPDGNEKGQSRADTLANAIPSEVLAAYTALVGLLISSLVTSDNPQTAGRWLLYLAGLVLTIAWIVGSYVRNKASDKRNGPWLEAFASGFAFAAWGLIMPGSPLELLLEGGALAFWTGAISVVAALVLPFLPLNEQVKERKPKAV